MLIKVAINSKSHTSIVMTPYEMEFKKFASGLSECKKGGKFEAYFIRGGDMIITKGDPDADNPELRNDHYHRNDKSLKSASLLVLDADGSIDDPKSAPDGELIHNALTKMGYIHVIYSTHSHKVGNKGNRYRVVIPCKMENKDQLYATVNKIIKEIVDFGVPLGDVTEARTWSQPWFFPTRDDPSDGLFEFYSYYDGTPYIAPKEYEKGLSSRAAAASSSSAGSAGTRDIREIMSTIMTMGEGVHHCINDYLYGQIKDGVPKKIAVEVLRTLLESVSPELKDKRWKQRMAELDRSADGASKRVKEEKKRGIINGNGNGNSDEYIDSPCGSYTAFDISESGNDIEWFPKVLGVNSKEEIKEKKIGTGARIFDLPKWPEEVMKSWPEPWPLIWENWKNFSAHVVEPLLLPTILSFHGFYLNGKYVNERGRRPNMYFLNLAESTAFKDTNSKDVLRNIDSVLAEMGVFNTIFSDLVNVDGNITSDTAFLKLLESKGGSLYWINTEATRVFQMLSNSGNNSSVMALSDKMIEVVDGYSITGKAKANEGVKGVDNPNIQIVFYAQPETIEEYISMEMIDSGFIGRSVITLDDGFDSKEISIFGRMKKDYCNMDDDLAMFYSQNRINEINGKVVCTLEDENLQSAIGFEKDVLMPLIKKSDGIDLNANIVRSDSSDFSDFTDSGGSNDDVSSNQNSKISAAGGTMRKMITRMGNTSEQLYSIVYGVCREWDLFFNKENVRESIEFDSLIPLLEYWSKVKAYSIEEFIDVESDALAIEIEDVMIRMITGELTYPERYEMKRLEGKVPKSEILKVIRKRAGGISKKLGIKKGQLTSQVNMMIGNMISAGVVAECYEVPNSMDYVLKRSELNGDLEIKYSVDRKYNYNAEYHKSHGESAVRLRKAKFLYFPKE
jgi:hypothetical protein